MIDPSLLGTASDADVARAVGLPVHQVRAARIAAGIAAFPRPVGRTLRSFRASDAEYAPVLAYAEAHGCDESTAIRALIGA